MKNDKKVLRKVKELNLFVNGWLTAVQGIGNQNASTDRILERILETTDKIKELYKDQFDYNKVVKYRINDSWEGKDSCGVLVTKKMSVVINENEIVSFANDRGSDDEPKAKTPKEAVKRLRNSGFKVRKI